MPCTDRLVADFDAFQTALRRCFFAWILHGMHADLLDELTQIKAFRMLDGIGYTERVDESVRTALQAHDK
jgi:hypothetical protein